MFVFNTIEYNITQRRIETPRSIRIIGLVSALVSYFFLYLALLSNAASRYIISVGLLFFIISGFYFFLKEKRVYFLNESKIKIDLKMMGILLKSTILEKKDIRKIYWEERSHGQTIQKKYRIFIDSVKGNFDLGIVNNLTKTEALIAALKKQLNLI